MASLHGVNRTNSSETVYYRGHTFSIRWGSSYRKYCSNTRVRLNPIIFVVRLSVNEKSELSVSFAGSSCLSIDHEYEK